MAKHIRTPSTTKHIPNNFKHISPLMAKKGNQVELDGSTMDVEASPELAKIKLRACTRESMIRWRSVSSWIISLKVQDLVDS